MKYLLIVVLLVAVLVTAGCVNESKNTVVPPKPTATVYFFYGEECPHCHTVMPFVQNLSKKYPDVNFRILETWHNTTNADIFTKINDQLKVPASNRGVPEVIVVGNATPLIGSRDIPANLENVIIEQLQKNG
jgi:thiol-disulfide isomerase/thioredoxin